ncbi:hypothetical protein BJV82DRAFT_395844 [Fennellomyces sp. T-0311]|nr:hypothetical protein BJV82DRAFT_395844 [Fennellomyces sp. T-0311]
MPKTSQTYSRSTLTPFESYETASKDSGGLFSKLTSFMHSNRRNTLSKYSTSSSLSSKASKSASKISVSIPRSTKTLVEADGHYSYGSVRLSGTTIMSESEGEAVSRLVPRENDVESEASDEYKQLDKLIAKMQHAKREDHGARDYKSTTGSHQSNICCIECSQKLSSESVLETTHPDRIPQLTQAQICDSCYHKLQAESQHGQIATVSHELDKQSISINTNSIADCDSPTRTPRDTEEDETIFAFDVQNENEMDILEDPFYVGNDRPRLMQRTRSHPMDIASSSNIDASVVADQPPFYAEASGSVVNRKSGPKRKMHHFSLPLPVNESSAGSSTKDPTKSYTIQSWPNIARHVQPVSASTTKGIPSSLPRPMMPHQQRKPHLTSASFASPRATESSPLPREHVQEKLRSLLQEDEDVIGQGKLQIWESVLMRLLSDLSSSKDLHIPGGEEVDIYKYLKIKKLPIGSPDDSYHMNGVMCTKNVAHRRMAAELINPEILILCFPLEWSNDIAEDPNLCSAYASRCHEQKLFEDLVERIIELQPSIVLVERDCIVPHTYVLEKLALAHITVVCHIKRATLDRVSRCTGAEMVVSMAQLMTSDEIILGHCGMFRVDSFTDYRIQGGHKKLVVFEQCPVNLGVTVVLQGGTMESLDAIKRIMRYMVLWELNHPLENALLEDLAKKRFDRYQKRAATCIQYSAMPSTNIEDKYHLKAIQSTMTSFQRSNLSVSSIVDIPKPHVFERLQKAHDEIVSFLEVEVPNEFNHRKNQMPNNLEEMVEFFNKFDRSLMGNGEYYRLREQYDHYSRLLKDYIGDTALNDPKLTLSMTHQKLAILECLTCSTATIPRHDTNLYSFKYYRYDQDLTLGQYVEHIAASVDSHCPSNECNRKMLDHQWCYVHGSGKVNVEVKSVQTHAGDTETEDILMWSYCKHCKANSPELPMSASSWKYSFGKFLELLFCQTKDVTMCGQQTYWWCPHLMLRDHDQLFYVKGAIVSFRYEPIQLYEAHIPSVQLRTEKKTCTVLKDTKRDSIQSEILHFYDSVLECLENLKLATVHPDLMDSRNERLRRMTRDAKSEMKDTLINLEDAYKRTSPADTTRILNTIRIGLQRKAEQWDLIHTNFVQSFIQPDGKLRHDSDPMLRHCTSMMSLEDNLDQRTQAMVDTPDLPLFDELENIPELDIGTEVNCHPELGESPTASRRPSLRWDEDIAARLSYHNEGQCSTVDVSNANSTNASRFHSFVAILPSLPSITYDLFADAIKSISTAFKSKSSAASNGDDQSGSSESLQEEPDLNHETFPTASIDDLDVVHVHEETSILDRQVHCETITRTTPLLSLGEDTGLIDNGFPIITLFRVTHSSMSEDASRSKIEQTDAENWFQALIRKWTGRDNEDESPSLVCPLSSTEHSFPNSPIIVDEDEPSTIVAYTLNSREYLARVKVILNEHRAAHGEQDIDRTHEQRKDAYIESRLRDALDDTFKKEFEDGQSKFVCEVPFMKQFDALQRKCGCESSYIDSLASACRSSSFTVQGRTLAYSMDSHVLDGRLLIKVISSGDMDDFLKLAPKYFRYLADIFFNNGYTAFMKILGAYRLKYTNMATDKSKDIDILVMENPFNGYKIDRMFNLKGSSRNRYLEATGSRDEVLLDGNLREFMSQTSPLYLHPHSKLLLTRSIESDTRFLSKSEITNYSLLLGIDETNHELVVAITDFYREYTFDKLVEYYAKSFISGGRDPTVRPPVPYRNRFQDEVNGYFLWAPDFWTKLDT